MGQTSEITPFLNIHRDQLISSGVPEYFWQALHTKLVNQTFNSSDYFELLKFEPDDEKKDEYNSRLVLRASKEIKKSDPQHIYLIDHAWTYKIQDAKKQLSEHDSLRERLCNVFEMDIKLGKGELVNKLFDNLWKINNYYSIGNANEVENRLPIWYVMDEVGTGVVHNDNPNCRIVPFVYINDQITYSLLFPIKDIEEECTISRDFAEGLSEPKRRDAFLFIWTPKTFGPIDINPPMPGEEYFLSGHIKESLPDLPKLEGKMAIGNKLNVFSQYSLIHTYLKDKKFDIVDNPDKADILWYTEHFKDFEKLSECSHKFINQFPFEYVLTVKDLLCITCRRKKSGLQWLPTSYNLVTEIENFISYFQKRTKEGLENFWIVKPYNLARGLDIHITNNLNYILKVSVTGPKIVQKYITNPVLFYRPECGRVKFDIRYVLLLESVKPLKAYVYKHFFLRFANKPFELDNFEDYEKHFTVMNYTRNAELKHMKSIDFLLNWMVQYPDHEWDTIEKLIFKMLRDILKCATIERPPCGIAHSPQSRALYAADIMLEWTEDRDIRPKILEINFTPDCKRACDYYPEFYNDIFTALFLNESVDTVIPL